MRQHIALLLAALFGILLTFIAIDSMTNTANAAVVTLHCKESHRSSDDPIVHPGQPGAAHRHIFFGSTRTNAYSTADSLRGGPTTCKELPGDTGGYWAPEVYVDGVALQGLHVGEYWRDNGRTVVAPPPGMAFVASGWGTNVGFRCTNGNRFYDTPQNCADGGRGKLKFGVMFPQCWDGAGVGQAAFRYASGKLCPAGYQVRIPQLLLLVNLEIVSGVGRNITLSSGPYTTMHADFLNGWDQAVLQQAVVDKLNS